MKSKKITARSLRALIFEEVSRVKKSRLNESSFWEDQFRQLDVALPHYNSDKVTDWNKVMNHYRASGLSGRDAGTPAHWYHEYRSGRMSMSDAAKALDKDLPGASRKLTEASIRRMIRQQLKA